MKTCPSVRAVAALLVVVLASIGGGCASYTIKVDAIRRPGPVNAELTSFKIQNRIPTVGQESLRYNELADHIKTALSGHGLWEAPNADSADLIVEVDCGITSPRVVYASINVPVFGCPNDQPPESGAVNAGNSGATRLLPVSQGREELVDIGEVDVPVLVREKHMTVSCRENKVVAAGRPPAEIWRVSVSIEDEGADLRRYLPVLAAAMMEQIGRNTDGVVTDTMSKKDDAIGFIKKGI